MFESLQFSLLDMTPYNRQSWFNLIGEYNQAIWFVFPIALVIILLMFKLLFKSLNTASDEKHQKSTRWILTLLGIVWMWNGAVFHAQYFTNLNWAAPWFGGLFIVQACLLFVIAFFMSSAWRLTIDSLRRRLGLTLLFIGIVIYPLSLLFEGRSFSQIEVFPLHPTPVLLVSFALIIMLNSAWRHAIALIPIVWAIISGAFAMSLGLIELYFIAAALLMWSISLLIHLFSKLRRKNK